MEPYYRAFIEPFKDPFKGNPILIIQAPKPLIDPFKGTLLQIPLQWKPESWNIISLMPLKYSIGNPSTYPPKSMFQLSGVHCKGTQF